MPSNYGALLILLSTAGSLLGMGCSGEHPVDRMEALHARKLDVFCRCYSDRAFSSESECRAYYESDLTDAEAECIRGVYATSSAELDGYLTCYSDADEAYYECVESAGCGPLDACVDAFQAAIESCPDLSDGVAADLRACY